MEDEPSTGNVGDDRQKHSPAGDTRRTETPRPRRPSAQEKPPSNSILARLNFLRTSLEDTRPEGEEFLSSTPDETPAGTGRSTKPIKTRRRTGSLRKTAILGPGRIKAETREQRSSHLRDSDPPSAAHDISTDESAVLSDESLPLTDTSFSNLSALTSNSPESLSLDTASVASLVSPPTKSPTDASNASTTTDDDDALTFSRPIPAPPPKPSISSSASSSYFPSPEVPHRRPGGSPLAALPMDYSIEHSYSETEWWGWVVLITTWLVFVVGMGSCLDVWSWAWDVSERPYAPPELEDDPTLPIVGYYPALMILTAVMAWVWVVVAWVGMKYFKHAKIPGDD